MAYLAGVSVPCCFTAAYAFGDRPALAAVLILTGIAPAVVVGTLFIRFRRRAAH